MTQARPDAAPQGLGDTSVPFHRLARHQTGSWWKPLLEILIVLITWLVVTAAIVLVTLGVGVRATGDGAAGLAVLGLSLAALIPACRLAAVVIRGSSEGLASVAGRVRWPWLIASSRIAFATMAAAIAILLAIALATGETIEPSWPGWNVFAPAALVIVLVIPLQAAGEEYLFRGVLLQAFGAWTRNPWLAITLSALVFGAGHGFAPPVFVATAISGLLMGWVAVRTGGLEAPIAMHVANNVIAFLLDALDGRTRVSQINASLSWWDAVLWVAYTGVMAVLIVRASRSNITRRVDERTPATQQSQPTAWLQAAEG
jgi:uncharacterized protein